MVPDNSNDIIGLIAYGLYKRKKIEFIKQYIAENNGTDLEGNIIHDFHMASLQHIDGYRLEAAEFSHAFAKTFWDNLITDVNNELEEAKERFEKEYSQEFEERYSREIDKLNRKNEERKLLFEQKIGLLKPKFWYGVAQSIVASFLILFVVFSLFVATETYRIDAINTFRNLAEIVKTVNAKCSSQAHPPAQE
ncbi:hypothetical protein [Desulfobacter curvatus]|uniref:hypothetical protein n=1 Tax=Desulfobacter curvatus TaxID=2290 RepID=UPI00039BE2FE|nr:hypothetical protein [Desulfobacter curvatus]